MGWTWVGVLLLSAMGAMVVPWILWYQCQGKCYIQQISEDLDTPLFPAYSCRHNSFFCSLLCSTSQILQFFFLHTAILWQPWVEQVYWHHFSNSICSLSVLKSHFGTSHNIINFLIITMLWWSIIGGLWCYYCKKIITCWMLQIMTRIFYQESIFKLR